MIRPFHQIAAKSPKRLQLGVTIPSRSSRPRSRQSWFKKRTARFERIIRPNASEPLTISQIRSALSSAGSRIETTSSCWTSRPTLRLIYCHRIRFRSGSLGLHLLRCILEESRLKTPVSLARSRATKPRKPKTQNGLHSTSNLLNRARSHRPQPSSGLAANISARPSPPLGCPTSDARMSQSRQPAPKVQSRFRCPKT